MGRIGETNEKDIGGEMSEIEKQKKIDYMWVMEWLNIENNHAYELITNRIKQLETELTQSIQSRVDHGEKHSREFKELMGRIKQPEKEAKFFKERTIQLEEAINKIDIFVQNYTPYSPEIEEIIRNVR